MSAKKSSMAMKAMEAAGDIYVDRVVKEMESQTIQESPNLKPLLTLIYHKI